MPPLPNPRCARSTYRRRVSRIRQVSELRFLLSRRWIGFALFVVVLAAVCIRLGFWQIHRLEHRLDNNTLVTRHLAADPVPLVDRARPGEEVDEQSEWTRVRATGTYDVEHEVDRDVHDPRRRTRRGRRDAAGDAGRLGGPGRPRLAGRRRTRSRTAGERARSPAGAGHRHWAGCARTAGPATTRFEPHDGQVRAISSTGMASSVPYDARRRLPRTCAARNRAPRQSLALEPRPELGQGPHFFYALQWWFFGGLAVFGLVLVRVGRS